MVARQQTPKCFGVRLHAVRPADHQHRVVQNLQRALHLRRKVHMSRRVQQGDRRIRQRQLRLLRENRNAALALERECIQKGIPMIHTSELFQCAGGEQQRFRKRGFPRVHVCKDADYKSFHSFLLVLLFILL